MKIALCLLLFFSLCTYGATKPKSIIGIDERTKVTNLFSPPYSAIGQIGDFCTGSLIDSNIVITAAHCVSDIFNPNLYFSLSKNGMDAPYGRSNWSKIIIPSAYKDYSEKGADFAFIFLTDPIPKEQFYFNLTKHFDPLIPITISGYPQDKNNQMWKSHGLAKNDETRLYYPCDTLGGMSGAPIIQRTGDQFKLVGIHTRGETGINTGVLLRDTMGTYLSMAKRAIENGEEYDEIYVMENPYLDQDPIDSTKVKFKNNCREKIIVTSLIKNIRGDYKKTLRIISPRKTKLALKSYSDKVFYNVRSQSGSYTLYGKEKCGQGAAWPNCFTSKIVDRELDQNTIVISCK